MQDTDDLWVSVFAGVGVLLTAAFFFVIWKLYKIHKSEKQQLSNPKD